MVWNLNVLLIWLIDWYMDAFVMEWSLIVYKEEKSWCVPVISAECFEMFINFWASRLKTQFLFILREKKNKDSAFSNQN